MSKDKWTEDDVKELMSNPSYKELLYKDLVGKDWWNIANRHTEMLREAQQQAVSLKAPLTLEKFNLPHLTDLPGYMEESFPELMRMLYPRIYAGVDAFHSPKLNMALLGWALVNCMAGGYENTPGATRLVLPSMKYRIDHMMPTLFIAPDLLAAIMATDFRDEIDWSTLKLPYEHGAFALPKGCLSHPVDGEVSTIMWSRTQPGQYESPFRPAIPNMEVVDHAFIITAICPQTGTWYDSSANFKFNPKIRLRNMFFRAENIKDEDYPWEKKPPTPLDHLLTAEDGPFIESLGVIVFGTILAMNARPELVEAARLMNVVQEHKGKRRREFWSPTIVGKRYRIKREVPRVNETGGFDFPSDHREHGTHASPRMHWRRGHYREQPCGLQQRDRKTIWIEPTLVAALAVAV